MTSKNPYNNRWRYWYAAIADYMLAHPGCTNEDIALHCGGKASNTISLIRCSDTFQEYFAQRRTVFEQNIDTRLRNGLVGVAELGLELITEKLREKRTAVPLPMLQAATIGALDRLGYAPKIGPSVVVNAQQDNRTLNIAIDSETLNQARETLRLAEQARLAEPPLPRLVHHPELQLEATSVEGREKEESDAPLYLTS